MVCATGKKSSPIGTLFITRPLARHELSDEACGEFEIPLDFDTAWENIGMSADDAAGGSRLAWG
jgi:hypothetical protein